MAIPITELTQTRLDLQQSFEKHQIPIKVAITQKEIAEVTDYVNHAYERKFPALDTSHGELYRQNSFNLFSRNKLGAICASMSFVTDSSRGLPEEQYFTETLLEHRNSNQRILQIGRFVKSNSDNMLTLTNEYVQLPYLVPWLTGYDIVVGMVRECDVDHYVNRYKAKIIERFTGETYGGKHQLSTLKWVLKDIKPNFLQKPNLRQKHN